MLFRFLNGLSDHLEPGGEDWLVLSDLAEHLGLRPHDDLLAAIQAAARRARPKSRPCGGLFAGSPGKEGAADGSPRRRPPSEMFRL